MRITQLAFLSVIIIGIAGCATPATSTFDYQDKQGNQINNEIVVNNSYDAVWSRLVRSLAKSFLSYSQIWCMT